MIWAASHTGGGLSRFDPTTEQWRRYQHDPDDPDSLSSNIVFAIFEDSIGALWIGTEGGGLNRFEGETEAGVARFTRYPTNPDDPSGTSSDYVITIYEDRSGVLWVGTYGGGLNRYDRETETFTRYRHDPDDPASLSHDRVFTIYEDRSGAMWVGTYGGGLNRFDRETETFTHFKHDPDDPHSLSDDIVSDILEDGSGVLWIGTFGGGLNRLDWETDTFVSYQHDPSDTRSLGNNLVRVLFKDQSGILWIGAGSVIDRLDPFGQGFGSMRHKLGESNSLSNSDIRSVLEDRVGDLWIGTLGGLNHYDPETETFTHYLHDPGDPNSLGNNHVLAVLEDREGVLWIGLDSAGLARLDRGTEDGLAPRFTTFEHDPSDPQSLSDNDVMSLYEDSSGILWVGTWSGGLNAFDRQTEDGHTRFKRYQNDPEDPHSLGGGIVWAIHEDPEGVLWVGTAGGGLCRFNRESENFDCLTHDPDDDHSLSSDTVWAIHQDGDGSLWLGTSAGLNRFSPQTGQITHYTTADGLPHDTVVGILEDDPSQENGSGDLWLSTLGGLSRFDPQSGAFHNHDTSDGLPGDSFNVAAFRTISGMMLFGCQHGLTSFYPEDVHDNPNIPPVRVTDFELSNEPVFIGDDSPLQQSILETENVELTHEDHVISFKFASLDYASPEKNRYRYKLEGFDVEWTEVGSDRRNVTYTNLDPGTYVFKVIGSNDDGLWNEEGTSIGITITPPWWQTWWFRGGVILLLVGLVTGGFVWQRESSRRRERHLEVTVAERTHALDERVKELDCLYGISRLAGNKDVSLEQIISGAVDLLPPAMQYPEIGCARIVLDGEEFKTDDFRETPWGMNSAIVLAGGQGGHVEVCYLEERPEADEGPFSTEERLLINAVADLVGRIYETKQAEEALHYQATLLKNVTDAVIATDLDLNIRSWNDAAEDLYGWRAEEVIGKSMEEVVPVEYPNDQPDAVLAQFQAEGVWQGEVIQKHKDGSDLSVLASVSLVTDEDGRPVSVLAVNRDISELKKAVEKLIESEAKYRDLVEKTSDVIYSVNSDGLITYLSPAVESLTGLPPEQLVGQPFTQFVHPEDLGRLGDNIKLLISGEAPGPAEYRALTTSGEMRWIRASSQPVTDGDRVTGLQGVLTDITERKKLDERREEEATLVERARLARRLHDAVTQTLFSASVIAEATPRVWLKDSAQAHRNMDQLTAMLRGAMAEMRSMIIELRPSAASGKTLGELLQTLVEANQPRTNYPVSLAVEGDTILPEAVTIGFYRVAQEALHNVVQHAEATEAGIKVVIDQEGAVLRIHDNGRGFDQDASPAGHFGLSIMRERLREIGCNLVIESQPGAGTQVIASWSDEGNEEEL
jgi:PAS domain S-box-containing protein